MMRRDSGFTLLEALIALGIFGLVSLLATVGVTSALRAQGLNESVTSSQAKLRRTTEVFTQELRSAILGGISNTPYTSNDHQVSFVTLSGGAGYPVLMEGYDDPTTFQTDTSMVLLWADPSTDPGTVLQSQQLLMVNKARNAVLFSVSGVSDLGNDAYQIDHSGCENTIDYDPSTVTIQSRSVGIKYDPNDHTLYLKEGSGAEVPMAFDLDSVQLQYVYRKDDGSDAVLSSPLATSGVPVRSGVIGGQSATLARVTLTLSTSAKAGGTDVSRTVSGTVEMSSNAYSINQVTPCN